MKDLNYQLMKLCKANRDGSFSTQATRRRILDRIANQLHELGYRRMQAKSLKPKHVDALVSLWKDQRLGVGTFKNRYRRCAGGRSKSASRHYSEGQQRLRHRQAQLRCQGIEGQDLEEKHLARISDNYVRLSLRLQAAFGLRREEAIKFSPNYAIKDDHIKLKASWTKGGRARNRADQERRQRSSSRKSEHWPRAAR